MAKYTLTVFENWQTKYELEADSEEDAIAKYKELKQNMRLVYTKIVEPEHYIDDAPSDSWIVERVEDE